ncbi:MAG: methyltransferase, partial [Treponema sp.]|nr:methyltransferase [Treponema sp.]
MGGSTGGKPPAPGPRAPVDGAASGPSRELPETDYNAYLEIYGGKTVPFRFRGRDLRFTLSLGLFSSADIDRGTRLLLKVLSRLLDEGGASPPRRILDCGCGAGIIGVCAARALLPPPGKGAVRGARAESPLVRCQDRDELARIVTQGNAALNGLDSSVLRAYTEPLLSGDPGGGWDLILSNIPAKAGEPVLDDFIRRSPALLAPAGRALIVVVAPLADFFRRRLAAAGVSLMGEEQGPEHRVLVYGAGGGRGRAAIPGGPA